MLNGMKTFGAFIALSVLSIQAATLSGRVTAGGSGSPVSGAKVVIISQQGSVDSTSTNAQGQYSLDDVATGPHTVVASPSCSTHPMVESESEENAPHARWTELPSPFICTVQDSYCCLSST